MCVYKNFISAANVAPRGSWSELWQVSLFKIVPVCFERWQHRSFGHQTGPVVVLASASLGSTTETDTRRTGVKYLHDTLPHASCYQVGRHHDVTPLLQELRWLRQPVVNATPRSSSPPLFARLGAILRCRRISLNLWPTSSTSGVFASHRLTRSSSRRHARFDKFPSRHRYWSRVSCCPGLERAAAGACQLVTVVVRLQAAACQDVFTAEVSQPLNASSLDFSLSPSTFHVCKCVLYSSCAIAYSCSCLFSVTLILFAQRRRRRRWLTHLLDA